jgi:peptidoglycan/LPS O-acetylase OafA/YrhL
LLADQGATFGASPVLLVNEGLKSVRLAALDGVRGVAILMVILGHILHDGPWRFFASLCGYSGVAVFFVLSGFLITRGLLIEEQGEGSINITRFYVQRIIRIWPTFYGFLLGLLILSSTNAIPASSAGTLLISASHLRNMGGSGWQTGHLWSLALEEQFYLLWPALLVILPRRHRLRLILLGVFFFSAGRLLLLDSKGVVDGLYSRPELRFDTFMIGGLLAIASSIQVGKVLAFASGLLLIPWMSIAPTCAPALDTAVAAGMIACFLKWLIDNPGTVVSRLISSKPLTSLGKVSYSLYLWQQVFFGPATSLIHGLPFTYIFLPLSVYCSYRFLEVPSLRLKAVLTSSWARRARNICLASQ